MLQAKLWSSLVKRHRTGPDAFAKADTSSSRGNAGYSFAPPLFKGFFQRQRQRYHSGNAEEYAAATSTSEVQEIRRTNSMTQTAYSEEIVSRDTSGRSSKNYLYPSLNQVPQSEFSTGGIPTFSANVHSNNTNSLKSTVNEGTLACNIGVSVAVLQKMLLAVGASDVDVPLLQCWAFHSSDVS